MVPRKKGQKYEISYRCPNYEKPFSERFDSYEAAKLRIAQIEYERSLGVFEPPKQTIIAPKKDHYVTVGELLDEYVQLYGLKHWGDSYLSSSQHFIAHYIKPAMYLFFKCSRSERHAFDNIYHHRDCCKIIERL